MRPYSTIAALSLLATGLATGFALGHSTPTRAANEAHVRTPVLWLPAPACGLVIERGGQSEPSLHLAYAVPHEDTELTEDELDDSRTHQFLAFCRQRPETELLPRWITRSDAERATTLGRGGASVSAEAIVDESAEWSDCFVRITADDDRLPITHEVADAGVDWALADVPAGVWSIAGYTFEPELNLWSPRPGFVKIVDDLDDPDQDVPALALLPEQQTLIPGSDVELAGCVDALGPSTITVEWAPFAPALEWVPGGEVAVDGRGPLVMPLTVPDDSPTSEILIRATVTDSLGRRYVAHAPVRFALEPCAGDCDDGTETAGANDEPGRGCACASVDSRATSAPIALSLMLIAVAGRRRRRKNRRDRRPSSATVPRGRSTSGWDAGGAVAPIR